MTREEKTKYDMDYRKKHKKQFNVDLNIEEYDELTELLKKQNIKKVQFVRIAFEELKKGNFKLER